ncbi:hypothetical protein JCM11641_007364 [Rhodosporidiobolus odoratus]
MPTTNPPSPPPTAPAQNERLEIPTLPPPSSRFVLPPPPSDLLSRIQAFLPQIRDANAMLDTQDGDEEGREEAVVMEELSDSSEDDSDSSRDSSDASSSDDDEDPNDRNGTAEAAAVVGEEDERGNLARLLDISARPKAGVPAKKVLVQEEEAAGAAEKQETMEAE